MKGMVEKCKAKWQGMLLTSWFHLSRRVGNTTGMMMCIQTFCSAVTTLTLFRPPVAGQMLDRALVVRSSLTRSPGTVARPKGSS